MPHDYLKPLLKKNNKKIVMLIMDGIGGIPQTSDGLTELETAKTPNMDKLASAGVLGSTIPIRYGITPGSGPAHLALFGYDPIDYQVGRGAYSATGVGVDFKPGDIATRGNLCTVDADGKITDRRAGRLPTEEALPVIEKMRKVQIPGVDIAVEVVKEYRFVVRMRPTNNSVVLFGEIDDTDPQKTGVPPLPAKARNAQSEQAADLFNQWLAKAREAIADEPKANSMNLRGFAADPGLPKMQDAFGLKPACVAVYPMYKGVSKLVGMDIVEFDGSTPSDEFKAVADNWDKYDFFFVHIKYTDSRGEDGDFDAKVKVIEGVDQALPELLALKPDVLLITGDHSTPAVMASHSWHPVPFLLWSSKGMLPDVQEEFGERACQLGGLGTFPATEAMSFALAASDKLEKYGA